MRFRHYDPTSAHFGVQDTYLGNTFNPASLNRYLFCESDPINNIDPTGHARATVKLRKKNPFTVNLRGTSKTRYLTSWDAHAKPGRANISAEWRLFNQLETTVTLYLTRAEALRHAWGNTVKWVNERANKIEALYGSSSRASFSEMIAQRYKKQMEAIYCGSAQHMKDTAAAMHDFSNTFGWIPIVGTLVEWNAYVAEGDIPGTIGYGVLAIVETLTAGGFSSAKAGGKIAFGAGMSTATKEGAKTIVGGEVKIGSTVIRDSSDAAELIVNATRKDHGLKEDAFHRAASFLDKEYLSTGTVFRNDDGAGILLQVEGGVNGRRGIFEYVVESDGKISHQRFVENGTITGKTNQN